MTIEKAHRKDYLEIAALDRIVWLDYPNGENIADGEHTWRHWVEDAIVRLWRQDGRIAGVALAFPTIARGFCLHKVFVEQSARGQGAGRQLLQRLLDDPQLKSAPCYLTVNPANHTALALYREFGFEAGEVVQGYYRQNEPRLEMWRKAKT
ncbi:MAG: GNAT family N-acetyltransferase [Leptospiraceae bacterium]|nr:GNAT family N-acetyltransferase [Leptospiraceae bacterium]